MCPHINVMPQDMIVRDTPMSSWVSSGRIFLSICHPTSCFIATKYLQNNPPPPRRFRRYARVRRLGREGTVSGCEEQGSAAALCSSVRQCCTCMAGWVWLVQNSDVILPGFGFLSTLTLPTGSFAAVTQLLSHSLSPCMCVCVCSALGHFLFATHMLLPVRSAPEWYELWVVGCVPARVFCERLFFASEAGQPSSLLCSLSRTTWTSSSRPAGR